MKKRNFQPMVKPINSNCQVKKLYHGPIMRDLSYKEAVEILKKNPEMVITRREWIGFHFIEDKYGYAILLKEVEVMVDVDINDVYDTDKKDWIVAYPTKHAISLIEYLDFKMKERKHVCHCTTKCVRCNCK